MVARPGLRPDLMQKRLSRWACHFCEQQRQTVRERYVDSGRKYSYLKRKSAGNDVFRARELQKYSFRGVARDRCVLVNLEVLCWNKVITGNEKNPEIE